MKALKYITLFCACGTVLLFASIAYVQINAISTGMEKLACVMAEPAFHHAPVEDANAARTINYSEKDKSATNP